MIPPRERESEPPVDGAAPTPADIEPPDAAAQEAARRAHDRFLATYFASDASAKAGESAPAKGTGMLARPASTTIDYRDTRRVQPPAQLLEKQRVVSALTHQQLADTFRMLRTRVLHRMNAHGFSTLAVTSPSRGDGKTLTAVNLAISLAANRTRTVLLVDLDLRVPKVHTHFGLPPRPGLQECLAGVAPLADCLVHPEIDRLVVLPAGGEPIIESSDVLASPEMTGLADELKTRYADRIIIYDLPPLLASDDAIAFLKHVDCCLLTVAEGGTTKRAFEQALDLLEGCAILGTVLNRATDAPLTPYSDYYGKR
jgi:protein-tyrosine kinase